MRTVKAIPLPMMACGCRANSYHRKPDGTEEPACVVHAGLHPGAYTPVPEPDLSKRRARCAYYKQCGQERASTEHPAFFVHKPAEPFDEFYCGCHGWD